MKVWWLFLYALFLTAVDSYAADDCNISLNGSNVTEARLSVGDSVILECTCETDWEQNEEYIIDDSHHYITSGNTLTILAVRSSDSGNYTCGDSNITLIVNDTYVESVFIPNPSPLCVNEPVLFECAVTLNTVIGFDLSVLNISWFHNGTYIPTNNITRNDEEYLYISILQLPSVNDTNSGKYTCEANVIESERSIVNYTFVYVQAKPVVHIMTESLLLYPGDDTVINCSSSAGSYTITGPNLISSNQPVTINSFSYENEGDYNCSSSNMCGENFEFLTIQMKIPNVTISGSYTSLRVGSSTDIECETDPSIPNAVIEWQEMSSFNSYSNKNELTINPVLLSDDNKIFTCVVSSLLISRNLTESINITVIDTRVSTVSIKFNSSYVIGEQAFIQCSISLTNPIGPNISSLSIKWFKSGEIIRDYIVHDVVLPSSVFHSSLTIPSLSFNDAGVYNCTASLTGSTSDEPITDSMALCLKVLYDDNPNSATNIALGYSAAIDCVNISSLAEITIKWRDESGNIITNNNTLVFPNVLPSLNDTLYTCTAEVNANPDSCPHSETKTVKVTVKETYIERVDVVSHESFLIDSTVLIECNIILNTPVGPGITPNVTWYHNMTDITQYSSLMRDNDIVFISLLTIDSAQVSNAGVYQCNAGIDSNVTTNSISVCVTVNETLPSVTEELSLGQYYSIDCITGPIPTGVSVSWLLTNGSIYSNSNTLIIPSILPSHSNIQYDCRIMIETNPSDCSTQSQVITLTVKATYINSVTILPTSIVRFINTSVVLTCNISFNTGIGPDTSFISHYWYQYNTDISDRSTPLMINGDSKSLVTTLTITNVQPSDAGDYQCGASIDGNDTVVSSTARLCIQVNETLLSVTEELSLGQYYSIDCITGPIPTGVSVSWLLTDGSIYSNNNTLMIPSILPSHDNTQYTCTIMIETNPSNCSTQSQVITFRVKATYINSVTVLPTSVVGFFINTSVLLACTIRLNTGIGPNTSFISHYWYQYSTDISNRSTQLIINGDSKSLVTTLTITNVQPSDAGDYQCGASIDGNDTVVSSTARLCIQVNETLLSVTEELSLGQYYSIDCITGPIPTGVSVSWLLTDGSIYSNNNTLMIPSILPSHDNTQYTCTIMIETNPSNCSTQSQVITFRVKATYINSVTVLPTSVVGFFINTSVLLACTIRLNTGIGPNTSFISHYWYQYSTDISDRSTPLMINGDSKSLVTTLTITNVQPSDAGDYQCGASIDGNDTVRSNLTNLCVEVPDSVITIGDSYTDLTIGDTIKYDCTSGYRQSGVIIQWRTPTGTLLTNPLMLTVNHSVTYTCIIRVEDNDCQNFLTKSVTFKTRDTFVKEVTTSSSLLILSDTLQQLKCNSTTNTNININGTDISSIVRISWYRYNGRSFEGIKISNSSSGVSISPTVLINNTLFQSTLIFSPITSSTPTTTLGNYTCVAWIGEESVRNMTSNDVKVLMKINNSRDLVSFDQLHSLYTSGDDLVINCTITPYEMSPSLSTFATIELIHNKVSVVESVITSNEYTNITISKSFNGVKLSDAGTYTCQYYLKYSNFTFVLPSEIKTDYINLFVMIPNKDSPLISLIPDEQYYDVGSNVTLICSINPPPPDSHIDVSTAVNISLFTGNDSLIRQSSTNSIIYELNNLQLHETTSYTCTYFISSDNDSSFILNSESTNQSIELVVRKIEVNINSSHVILLDYPPYNNASITCSLMYEPMNQFQDNELQNWFYQTNNTNVTLSLDEQANQIFEKEVSYTRPGISLYECGVTLLIKGKESNYSNSINVTVKGPVLPNRPINVTSIVLNTTSVRFEWVVTSVTYTPETYTVLYESLSCYHNGSISITGSTSVEVFTEESDTQYSVTVDDLMPGIMYNYYIVSRNTEGYANTANETFKLLETTPNGHPLKFEAYNTTAYEMTFTWLPPLECFRNGDVIKYSLNCSFINATHPDIQQSLLHQVTSKRENRFTLHNLYSFTNYTCHLTAANSIGEGPAVSLNVTTLEASPESEPENLTIISTSSSSLVLTWSKPIQPNGIIIKYTINCSSGIFDNETIDNIAVLSGLEPYTNYTCSVSAHTRIGAAGPAATVTGQTDESTPEAISSSSIAFSDTLILFYWMEPLVTNGHILYYQINLTTSSSTVKTLQSNRSNYITIESDPFVPYQLSIAGYTTKGRGELWISSVFFSKEGMPPNGPENVTAVWINSTTVKVTWLPLTLAEARGFITQYSVYAGNTGIVNVSSDSSIAYIDNLNPMLQYSISVSASTKVGESSNNSMTILPPYVVETSSNWLLFVIGAAGGGFAGVICICCTIVVCFCCRRRSRKKNPTKTEEAVELYSYMTKITTDSVDNDYLYIAAPLDCQNEAAIVGTGAQRINVNEFPSFVSRSKRSIEYEFEEIERISPVKATSIANKNAAFNRFKDISPFDDNIVPLSTSEKEEDSLYINASYIDGYQRRNSYIATQGPLTNTVGHFWQMIIEYKLPTIVMLTRVFEGDINKCAQYWPEKVNETHKLDNGIIIRTKTEELHCWYTKRQLLITKDDDSISMTITHYQLMVWPDHGVPVDKIVMISFIDNIRSSHPPKGPPLVVHCSAGVGRTGTFIVMDTMLQKMKEEDTLNIYDFLSQIRHQRMKLVQNKEQYIYIHKSLADHIRCGDTSFAIEKAHYRIKELRKKNVDEECEFQKEFELLKDMSDNTSTISCSIAEDNQERNRFKYNLPYNHTRVLLRDTENDYINASWVEGYRTGNWFIVTQIPLESTQTNFWTMIHQQNCNVIVLLHPVRTDEIPQFWPAQIGQTIKYQDLSVEHSLEKEENDYQIITLELKFKNDSAHNVTLYYYKKWNINTNSKPYVKPLFGILAKNQLENGNRPIVVACNDGVGCSGTFLTAYSQIERAKIEGVSDVFQFIRKARSQRPGLVDCLERYIYCHELLSEYAEGMLQHEETSYI